jgi:1-aminocyclopropane-1-carboxylate deaminase
MHTFDIKIENITVENWISPFLKEKGITAAILRLDKIHPHISGNKWFKLKYYLQEAAEKKCMGIITSGGAYSNHIVAAACAAQSKSLKSIGIIRGEEPAVLSPTLLQAKVFGMEFVFISREKYKHKEDAAFLNELQTRYKDYLIIPEGGAGVQGAKGCSEITGFAGKENYTHILSAMGTGTMFAGILNAASPNQSVIGVPVLKGITNFWQQAEYMIEKKESIARSQFFYDYHFGGYVKYKPALIEFMNNFYSETGIPTDFVYTGKLVFAVNDLLQKNYFTAGSRLLIIHSGGLQGNAGLPKDTLIF